MAAAPVLLAGALALLAAPASARFYPMNPIIRPPSSEYTTSRLFEELLEPMCTESSSYDACYGCFTRYSRMTQVQAAYEELKKCVSQYLNDTPFAQCSAPIVDAKGNLSQRPSVFCEFETCVRKSKMQLVLEECVKQSDNSKSKAEKYIQTTSCILEELQRVKNKSDARRGRFEYGPDGYAVYAKDGELRARGKFSSSNDIPSCDKFYTPPDQPFPHFVCPCSLENATASSPAP